jgi:hypothetical protein
LPIAAKGITLSIRDRPDTSNHGSLEDPDMTNLKMPSQEAIFTREDNSVIFNQLGVKLELDSAIRNDVYYAWLDGMIDSIGKLVPGAEIAEKNYARAEPRLNVGVYYDTGDRMLLRLGAVLRTTCNKKTHAFCAFKRPVDEHSVRRDHRHIFDGDEKATIQHDPRSLESVAIIRRLLARTDIEHPGTHLLRCYGIHGDRLTPSICIEQYRHPFFVWLDKKDALRCTMDRAYVFDLRLPHSAQEKKLFTEVELPVYPRIDQTVAQDPRVLVLIDELTKSLSIEFGARLTTDNKYQRAAKTLAIN